LHCQNTAARKGQPGAGPHRVTMAEAEAGAAAAAAALLQVEASKSRLAAAEARLGEVERKEAQARAEVAHLTALITSQQERHHQVRPAHHPCLRRCANVLRSWGRCNCAVLTASCYMPPRTWQWETSPEGELSTGLHEQECLACAHMRG
jgi:hypothetical protein